MNAVTVKPAKFTDLPGMPHVHTDPVRRIITEEIVYKGDTDKIAVRTSRIEVTGHEVPLGHHYHDFVEKFTGIGGGMLYTAPADNPTDVTPHTLPEGGWEVDIPAEVIHVFVLSHPALLVTRAPDFFIDSTNQDQYPGCSINTHRIELDLSRITA